MGIRYPGMRVRMPHLSEAVMSGVHELETVSSLSDDPGEDSLLTPQDAARFLKVSVSWVYEHIRPEGTDRLPFVKLGKYLRFDARDLRAYIDAKRAESAHLRRRR